MHRKSVVERFWSKVDYGDTCWSWLGSVRGKGYGQFGIEANHIEDAHRVAYRLAYGPIPEGVLVCHKCDNPNCVRPDHLFLGSHRDNLLDASKKGRLTQLVTMHQPHRHWGEVHATKLTLIKVREIQEKAQRFDYHKTNWAELAREYGVSRGTISDIVMGRRWKNALAKGG